MKVFVLFSIAFGDEQFLVSADTVNKFDRKYMREKSGFNR